MAESYTFDDFKRWKVDVLKKFCQSRGIPIGSYKRKDELVALAFAAYAQNLPLVPSKEQEKSDAIQQYQELLILEDGTIIPDPFLLSSGWVSENDGGLKLWPPCMTMNISEYLISNNERPLYTRLRNDYKEGMYSFLVIYNYAIFQSLNRPISIYRKFHACLGYV